MVKDNKLDWARREIDKIDGEMRRLFSARMKAVAAIAEEKKKLGRSITDKDREEAIKKRETENMTEEELKPLYLKFISEVISISKEYQKIIIEGSEAEENQNEN